MAKHKKKPSQSNLQDKVIRFLESEKIAYETVDESKYNSQDVAWVILAGTKVKNVLYVRKEFPTKLIFEFHITFAPEHQEATKQIGKENFSRMQFEWNDKLLTWDVNWQYNRDPQDNEKITSLFLRKFLDDSGLNHSSFVQTFARLMNVGNHVLSMINRSLKVQPTKPSTDNTPYFIG